MNIPNVENISRYRPPGVYLELSVKQNPVVFKTGIPIFVGFGHRIKTSNHEREELRWFKITSCKELNHFMEPALIGFHESKRKEIGYMSDAIRGFFENGGEYCFVLPIPVPETQSLDAYLEALKEPFLDPSTSSKAFQKSNSSDMLGILHVIDDIDLVCVPDLMKVAILNNQEPNSRNAVVIVQKIVIEYCERMGDRFAIMDAYPIGKGNAILTEQIQQLFDQRISISGSSGAVYFPWIQINHGSNELKSVPPCGHIAGIYARSDAQRGVFKAPANELIEGAFDLEFSLTNQNQTELNDAGINCLKSSLSRGIRVWGARTLSVHPADQYISTKRLFLTMVRWLEKNMSDLTYEANDIDLWNQIKFRVESYCYELFLKGAFKGKTPNEAYYVKCDRETNNLENRERGKVVTEIGLASVAPAEFIIVRITQSANGIATSALSLN